MNKIVLSSLIQIANELDNINLPTFASQLDDVMQHLAQKDPNLQQQLMESEISQQDLTKQIEEGDLRLKQDEMTQNWRKDQGMQAAQEQIAKLREQIKKQKQGMETEEQPTTPIETTAPTGSFGTFAPPSNYANVV